MLQQVADLEEEGAELHAFLDTLGPSDWGRRTPFKGWTVDEVVEHLYLGDRLAVLSLSDRARFRSFVAERAAARTAGRPAPALDPAPGRGADLLARWRGSFLEMCGLLAGADPKARLEWVGPDMGLAMFTTARQMETWAHGQDVYDLLRRRRGHRDRLKNIAVIGVRTYGWTFANRGLEPPGPAPYVRLVAPSGAIWEWNEPQEAERVEGTALEFCRVVTQGRNVADTSLAVTGPSAVRWMSIAQCFAGPPSDPPPPGERAWSED